MRSTYGYNNLCVLRSYLNVIRLVQFRVLNKLTMVVELLLCLTLSLVNAQSCTDGEVRLVGGSYYYGVVEVCKDGDWSNVCSPSPGLAQVVCRQLGLPDEDSPDPRMSLQCLISH